MVDKIRQKMHHVKSYFAIFTECCRQQIERFATLSSIYARQLRQISKLMSVTGHSDTYPSVVFQLSDWVQILWRNARLHFLEFLNDLCDLLLVQPANNIATKLVLCEYSKYRIKSNRIVTSLFDSTRNEHNYSKCLNTYRHQFLTYLTECDRFFHA